MLRLDDVSYRYAGADSAALAGITIELRAAEVVGLVGANEAGKSTVCLVASGLAPRAIGGTLGGRVTLDGADIAPRAMHELVGTVGIVFQNPETQLSGVAATVYDEVAFGPSNLGIPRTDLVERVESALATLGIAELAGRDPARLSGGQMQLVAIAGVLALRPAYLLLDEPTAQLDPAGTRLVAEALMRLVRGGAAILIAEHKTDLLARLCERIYVVHGGRVVRSGPASEILGDARGLTDAGVILPSAVRLRARLEAAGLGHVAMP